MISNQEKIIVSFLNCAGIYIDTLNKLAGVVVDRNEMISDEKYKKIKEMIPELKTVYSSSYMTSLQITADSTQKWPIINIVRQILKSCGYNLTPKRASNGYTITGKKLYKRTFIITTSKK